MAQAQAAVCPGGAIFTFAPEAAPQLVEHLARRIPPRARHRPDPATWVIVNPHAEAARWVLGEWAELAVL